MNKKPVDIQRAVKKQNPTTPAHHKLVDRIFTCLKNLPEFKNQSLDNQGTICNTIAKLLK